MQILVIEDDKRVAGYIRAGLKEAGHDVTHANDGESGLSRAAAEPFDLIVLDRMLPGMDGLKMLRTIRASGDHTPILLLSALADTDERVKGLRAGADDYLAKPFAFAELLARAEALGRRPSALADPTRIRIADLEIDLLSRAVRRGGHRIQLTSREFRILDYLARHVGRIVTRSMLLEHVWDYHFDPQTNVVDQHVSRLRQKLEREGAAGLIETVRGAGYRLRTSV